METVVHPQSPSTFLEWFPEFLRSELAPYPGRAAAVTRITLAAVITVVLVSTFRIPGAAIAVYNVFTVTRDSPTAAIRSALVSVGAITVGLALSMAGVFLFIDSQLIYFVYTVLEFFLFFWLTRVVVQPGAAINVGLAVYNVSNIWRLPYPAQQHVEATLWFWAAMVVGIVVAAVVEVFFVKVDPIDVLLTGVDERLGAAEELIAAYVRNSGDQERTLAEKKIASLAIVGTGALRRQLRAAENGHAILRQYLAELNSVIALSGRLVDLLANTTLVTRPAEIDHERFARLGAAIGPIRSAIRLRQRPDAVELGEPRRSIESPLLPEIEKVVSLIPQAFSPAQTVNAAVVSEIDGTPKTRWLAADAFSNPEYIHFALKGCLAATSCYVIYTALDWPEISTSVVTCMVTALSTLGASRQKQFLRISGATVGGLLALLSIVFLLPNMDRITPVALLIAAVTAASAWVATSSPRLSYFGLQTVLAFYITVLQDDYTAPTTLSPARDRFVGVLLGLTVMWIVAQSLWPSHAANAMLEKLRENIRQVARLVGAFDETEGDRLQLLPAIRRLREVIDGGFQIVQEHAGTILFEFGPDRSANLETRERTLRVQASIRTVFLLSIAILQYRIQSDARMIPSDVRQAQLEFNRAVQARLNRLADTVPRSIDTNGMTEVRAAEDKLETQALGWYKISGNEGLLARVRGVVSLSKQMVTVLDDI